MKEKSEQNQPVNRHFAVRVKSYRGRSRLTQAALGAQLGVSAPTICQYEHGLRLASKKVLSSMRSVFALTDKEYVELIHLASSVDAEPLY